MTLACPVDTNAVSVVEHVVRRSMARSYCSGGAVAKRLQCKLRADGTNKLGSDAGSIPLRTELGLCQM